MFKFIGLLAIISSMLCLTSVAFRILHNTVVAAGFSLQQHDRQTGSYQCDQLQHLVVVVTSAAGARSLQRSVFLGISADSKLTFNGDWMRYLY